MSKEQRRTLFVDAGVQRALVVRAIGYSLLSTLVATTAVVLWLSYGDGGHSSFGEVGGRLAAFVPALAGMLLALPLVVIDTLRFSNRFAGPLFRLRRSLRKMARGEAVEPIVFRSGDYWHEIAEEFNAALARIERDRLAAAQGEPSTIQPPLYPLEVD